MRVPNGKAICRPSIINPISVILKMSFILLSGRTEYFTSNYTDVIIFKHGVLSWLPLNCHQNWGLLHSIVREYTISSPYTWWELQVTGGSPLPLHGILLWEKSALQIEALFKNLTRGRRTFVFIICSSLSCGFIPQMLIWNASHVLIFHMTSFSIVTQSFSRGESPESKRAGKVLKLVKGQPGFKPPFSRLPSSCSFRLCEGV